MATASNRGVDLHYQAHGSGPTVVFINDAGYGAWLWGWHTDSLPDFETLVWDLRGTGRSDAPEGPYSVSTLAADLEAVLSAHGVADAHLVGAGLGGMVALEYAHRFGRAETLTLYCTAASGEAVDEAALARLSLDAGPKDSLEGALSDRFREQATDVVERITEWRRADDATGDAFDAQAAAMTTYDPPPLYEVTQPAEGYFGVEDPVIPAKAAETLAADLPRGTSQAVEGRHACYVEHATAVTDRLVAFLDEHTDRE